MKKLIIIAIIGLLFSGCEIFDTQRVKDTATFKTFDNKECTITVDHGGKAKLKDGDITMEADFKSAEVQQSKSFARRIWDAIMEIPKAIGGALIP